MRLNYSLGGVTVLYGTPLLYGTPYSTQNHNMILFKLLIKLYATVLLLSTSTRTRCLRYQSSENQYRRYRMYRIFSSGITYCHHRFPKTANWL